NEAAVNFMRGPRSRDHLGDGRTGLTARSKVMVRTGEPIRTQYEIPAPKINRGEVSIFGAGISRSFPGPESSIRKNTALLTGPPQLGLDLPPRRGALARAVRRGQVLGYNA